jgi:hypothetical protein
MGHSLWVRVAIVLLIILLAPIGETGAVPLNYEFTSGALRGGFAADYDPQVFNVFHSWQITAPTGFGTIVYDSTLLGAGQNVFANDNFCHCLVLFEGQSLFTRTSLFSLGYEETQAGIAGIYSFEHNINDLTITGSGTWAVPGPNTLWSFGLGLLPLFVFQWLKPSRPGV